MLLVKNIEIVDEKGVDRKIAYSLWSDLLDESLRSAEITLYNTETKQESIKTPSDLMKMDNILGVYKGFVGLYPKYDYDSLSGIEICKEYPTFKHPRKPNIFTYRLDAESLMITADTLGTYVIFTNYNYPTTIFNLLYSCYYFSNEVPENRNELYIVSDYACLDVKINNSLIPRIAKAKLLGRKPMVQFDVKVITL